VILIRVTGDTEDLVPAIRAAVDGPDPRQQVLIRFRNVQNMLDNSASQERFQAILLGIFSSIALLLSVVGVYGVMSYSTSQRIPEVGIRLALGAQPKPILRIDRGRGCCFVGDRNCHRSGGLSRTWSAAQQVVLWNRNSRRRHSRNGRHGAVRQRAGKFDPGLACDARGSADRVAARVTCQTCW
jgi:hypothetical protein